MTWTQLVLELIFRKVDFNILKFLNMSLDFKRAVEGEKSNEEHLMPIHENIIRNYVNVEIFCNEDGDRKDCLGWITILEKADEDLRTVLKEERIGLEERKKIWEGMYNGAVYLVKVGISHYDQKLENVLLLGGIPKLIDFGLVYLDSGFRGRSGYKKMGYARMGSKYEWLNALCKFIHV